MTWTRRRITYALALIVAALSVTLTTQGAQGGSRIRGHAPVASGGRSTLRPVEIAFRKRSSQVTTLVRPGQRVRKGQLLARSKDPPTLRTLRRAAATLRRAQARLAKDKRQLIARQKQAQMWSANAAEVRARKDALDAARKTTTDDRTGLDEQAAQRVALARAAAAKTQAALTAAAERTRSSLEQDWTAASADAAKARRHEAKAQAALAGAQRTAADSQAKLQATADQAQQAADAAGATQAANTERYQAAVDQAQQSLSDAQQQLAADQDKLASAEADDESDRNRIDSLRDKVSDQQARLKADRQALDACTAATPPSDCTDEQTAYDADRATLKDMSAKLDATESHLDDGQSTVSSLKTAVANDEGAVASAQEALASAQQAQAAALADDQQSVQSARNAVASAQESLDAGVTAGKQAVSAAQRSLRALRNKAASELARDRRLLVAAQRARGAVQAKSAVDRRRAAQAVQAARNALKAATRKQRATLAEHRQSVAQAAESLSGAQSTLISSLASTGLLAHGATSGDVAVAETRVEVAKLELARARQLLADRTELRAPAAGRVAGVSSNGRIRLTGLRAQLVEARARAATAGRTRLTMRLRRLRARLVMQVADEAQAHIGVVGIATQYLGVPYVWGGASPTAGFDCSGLTKYVYAQKGITLPHYAAAQYRYGIAVARDELQPGDLVFFDGLEHVGIYVGNDEFVQAPHTGDVVKISSLDDAYYAIAYVGARRLQPADDLGSGKLALLVR